MEKFAKKKPNSILDVWDSSEYANGLSYEKSSPIFSSQFHIYWSIIDYHEKM